MLTVAPKSQSFNCEYLVPIASDVRRSLEQYGEAYTCGSVRRGLAMCHDIDIVLCCAILPDLSTVGDVIECGAEKARVVVDGVQVDVRRAEPEYLGAMIAHCTGSREHNIDMRRRAASRGMKLNEYGLWRGGERIAGHTEDSLYAALGIDYIDPDKR